MKTLMSILIFGIIAIGACTTSKNKNIDKVNFSICQVVNNYDVPMEIVDTLQSLNVKVDANSDQFILGSALIKDTLCLNLDVSKEEFKLVKSFWLSGSQKYFTLLAIAKNPYIDNSCIKKVKYNKGVIEIYFNMKGAKLWADVTKKLIGRPVAFVIDNEVYSMPFINGEIRNGIAVISGITDEQKAVKLVEQLNVSREE